MPSASHHACLRVLPDPHIVHPHGGWSLVRISGRIAEDKEHRRGCNPRRYAPDVGTVVVIGYDPRLPVRAKDMPAARVGPVGAAGLARASGPHPDGIIRAMEV